MKGRTYLRIERAGRRRNELRVTASRSTKPSHGAGEGVWIALDLEVPEAAFQPYEAKLELPENDLKGVIVVRPRFEEEKE